MSQMRWTRQAREAFLAALRRCGNVSEAARTAALPRHAVYKLRAREEDFATAWEDALAEAVDGLEREAWRRAAEGVEEPLVAGGKLIKDDDGQVITIRKYNDRLLEFLLKSHRPERFKERVENQLTGKDGQALAASLPAVHVHIGEEEGEEPKGG